MRTLIVFFLLITQNFCVLASETIPEQSYLGLVNASQQRSPDHILELWGNHDYLGSETYADSFNLRYFNPLNIGSWSGIVRLDAIYTANYGPLLEAQSTGTYTPTNTFVTIWGGQADWLVNLGGRIIVPLGNKGQLSAGPQISTSYRPVNGERNLLSDISPLARFMFGLDSKAPPGYEPTPLARRLDLFPTIGLNLGPNTQIRFWDENGIAFNSVNGGWFVPIDAMVTHRLSNHFLIAIGAAKQVVQTYQLYDWSVYGKIAFNF